MKIRKILMSLFNRYEVRWISTHLISLSLLVFFSLKYKTLVIFFYLNIKHYRTLHIYIYSYNIYIYIYIIYIYIYISWSKKENEITSWVETGVHVSCIARKEMTYLMGWNRCTCVLHARNLGEENMAVPKVKIH